MQVVGDFGRDPLLPVGLHAALLHAPCGVRMTVVINPELGFGAAGVPCLGMCVRPYAILAVTIGCCRWVAARHEHVAPWSTMLCDWRMGEGRCIALLVSTPASACHSWFLDLATTALCDLTWCVLTFTVAAGIPPFSQVVVEAIVTKSSSLSRRLADSDGG